MNVTCNYCSKNFATEQDFNVHTEMFHQIAHSTNKLISCEYCSLKFKTMENFVEHVHACVWKIMTAKMIEHASFYRMKALEQPLNLKVIPPTSLTTSTVERNYAEQNLSSPTTVSKVKKLKKNNYALYETACDNCLKKFKHVRDLITHKKICEVEKIKVVPLASRTTSNAEQNSTEQNLSDPVNEVREVRKLNEKNNEVVLFQIACANCPMTFKYIKELVAHKKTCEAGNYQNKKNVMPLASLATSNVEQNSITKQNSSNSTEVCNVTKPDYHLLDNQIFSTSTPTSSNVYCVQKEDNSEDNSYDSSQIYHATKSQSDTSLFSDKSSVNVKTEQLSNDDKLCYTPPYTPTTVHCENCLLEFDKVIELVVHSQTCQMRKNACAMILPQCISCLQQFPSLEALNIHFSQCVKKDEIYKCPTPSNNLLLHIQLYNMNIQKKDYNYR